MVKYLQMDGVNDKLRIPTVVYDDIIIDMSVEQTSGKENIYIGGISGNRLIRITGGTDRYDSHWNAIFWNGIQKAWNTVIVPTNERGILKLVPKTLNTTHNHTNIFVDSVGTYGFTKGKIYSIKLVLGGETAAYYDMNTGTVQDQSGNGKHATLTGGTWLDDGTGGETTPGTIAKFFTTGKLQIKGSLLEGNAFSSFQANGDLKVNELDESTGMKFTSNGTLQVAEFEEGGI